jgi:hypothetical protein
MNKRKAAKKEQFSYGHGFDGDINPHFTMLSSGESVLRSDGRTWCKSWPDLRESF